MGWLGKLFAGDGNDRAQTASRSGGTVWPSTPPVELAERRPRMLMLHEGHLYPVVGEASYQPTLARLAGSLGVDGPAEERRWHIADLTPEPNNPHDPNAIGVLVGGEHVGYIPRDRTELYHPFLRWAQTSGWDGVSCRARIMGGFRFDGGEQAHLGIELHHTMPLLVQYDGPPPTIPEIDTGRVNLVGEQHHQEFLRRASTAGCSPSSSSRVRLSTPWSTEPGSDPSPRRWAAAIATRSCASSSAPAEHRHVSARWCRGRTRSRPT